MRFLFQRVIDMIRTEIDGRSTGCTFLQIKQEYIVYTLGLISTSYYFNSFK